MKPTIGRIVHYRDGGAVFPAIVVTVHSKECLNLHVFRDHGKGSCIETSVAYSEVGGVSCWFWPPRS